MKKCLAFGLVIVLIAVMFSACSSGNKETDKNNNENAINSSDLPTVTDINGNVVDYTVPTKTTTQEDSENEMNPYLDVGSLDDINNKAGTAIKAPKGIEITNEEFDINDVASPKVACYSFMVNGKDYSIWASRSSGPMLMGIYLDDGTAVGEEFTGTEELAPTKIDGGYVARWFNDGVQYNLYASGVTESEFKTIYNKVK